MKEKGYRIFSWQILILIAVWMTFRITAYATETGTSSGMSAKVYESMDKEGVVVANVIKGSVFSILSTESDEDGTEWYFICTDTGIEGYIPKTEVLCESKTLEQEDEEETIHQIEFHQNVNIRMSPSTDAEIVGRVPRHTILVPLQMQENEDGENWYQISYEGITGYVRESTVDIIEVEQESEVQEEIAQEQKESVASEVLQESSEEQDVAEYLYTSNQEENGITKSAVVKKPSKIVICEKTTRKSVNPIDHVVMMLVLGMLLSLLPVFRVIRRIRKERQKNADYNRKMRRG